MAVTGGYTFESILNTLKNKIYSPIYLLQGDEPYFIDSLSEFIENNILDASEKEFNLSIFYGKESDVYSIIDTAKSFPMMASYQIVFIKEAQSLKNIEALESYCQNPQKSTILIICYKYKTLDKRKSLYKAIDKNGITFESKTLYDNQIPKWIGDYMKNLDYSITPQAISLIAESIGNNLTKIVNELGKLIINVPKQIRITEKEIEENIGILKDYNTFEYSKALGAKDILKSNKIINYFCENPKEFPMVLIIGIVFNYFLKLIIYHKLTPLEKSNNNTVASALGVNPYLTQEYITAAKNYSLWNLIKIVSIIREYDLKSKGVDSNLPYKELIKEFTFKILHT